MCATYCCDSKAYEHYYLTQVGNDSLYFIEAPFQRGYGLGSIFGSIAKLIMPLMKSGVKAIGKQALKGGLGFASDVLAGKDAKQAAVDRAQAAGSILLRQAAKRKRKPGISRTTRSLTLLISCLSSDKSRVIQFVMFQQALW